MFTISNTLTILSSSAALLSGIFNLLTKRERTWLDYYQLCMSTFMLCNVLTKPITLKSVFESEQMQCLKQVKSDLKVSKIIYIYSHNHRILFFGSPKKLRKK